MPAFRCCVGWGECLTVRTAMMTIMMITMTETPSGITYILITTAIRRGIILFCAVFATCSQQEQEEGIYKSSGGTLVVRLLLLPIPFPLLTITTTSTTTIIITQLLLLLPHTSTSKMNTFRPTSSALWLSGLACCYNERNGMMAWQWDGMIVKVGLL